MRSLRTNRTRHFQIDGLLGDYEVRNWKGWHHHQVLSLIATWFLVTEARREKNWTPAITVPQIREGISAILARMYECGTPSQLAREREQRLKRNELARLYHWKRCNLLAPLNQNKRQMQNSRNRKVTMQLFSAKRDTAVNTQVQRRLFRKEIIHGFHSHPKYLPCKYFYDKRGSELFEEICRLEEYYLTRSELAIMEEFAPEMGKQIGAGVMLVEYGSGSSVKTRILLDHLPEPVAYVPVDISREHLRETASALAKRYPHIEILPVCTDFTHSFDLPISKRKPTHAAVYFPGSTIGNFMPNQIVEILTKITWCCGRGGGLLIGIDLKKDPAIIEAAYDDASGVTEKFNLNVLHRINRELKAQINVNQFTHEAVYNEELGRIEMFLVSRCSQIVEIGNESFQFASGERICTEYSHKYTVDEFASLATESGLALHRFWTDDKNYFAVLHLAVND